MTFPLPTSISVHKVASVWRRNRLISLRSPEKVSVCILALVFVLRNPLLLNSITFSRCWNVLCNRIPRGLSTILSSSGTGAPPTQRQWDSACFLDSAHLLAWSLLGIFMFWSFCNCIDNYTWELTRNESRLAAGFLSSNVRLIKTCTNTINTIWAG